MSNSILPLSVSANNPVQEENAKSGTSEWQLTNPATNREIEGYASLTSVNRGGTISFYISTAGSYIIDIYRMGWYDGAGARKMSITPIQLNGTIQPTPIPDPDGLIECNWTESYVQQIPNDWVSGVYVAKLTNTSGQGQKQCYIIFVVRDDSRASDYLFQSSVTTFQAYNNWPGKLNGGKSLYEHNSSSDNPNPDIRNACNADPACYEGTRATKVSFNRPYTIQPGAGTSAHPGPASGIGAGEFFTLNNSPATSITYSAAWEYNMVRYLEREGFDVTYCTNIDTHANRQMLLTHKALLSVGHDEYWSLEMRNNIEFARDSGVSLGFFSANVGYWQIRLEPSLSDANKPYRTIVCYKYASAGELGGPRDPFYTDPDLSNDNKITVKWRDPVLNRPEDALIGVMTDLSTGVLDGDITVFNAAHWVFAGTQLQNGDHDALAGLLGYEVDRQFGHAPVDTVTLAQSRAGQSSSDVTIYEAPSGAIVFSTGSMQWNWGLDDYNAPALRPQRLSAAAQQITRNVLNRMRQTASSAAATFVGTDDATRGDWKGAYGADGYLVVRDAESYPAYSQVTTPTVPPPVPWADSTSDVRALLKTTSTTDRVAATLYTETSLTIDINLTDGEEHRVAAYVLDWDGNNIRSQRFDVLDAATGVVLDTRSVAAFSSGRYLVWRLRGHVKLRMTHTGVTGSNAVISGLFFG